MSLVERHREKLQVCQVKLQWEMVVIKLHQLVANPIPPLVIQLYIHI